MEAARPVPPEPSPPALGRPSAASTRPGLLRAEADAGSAAYRADGGDSVHWSVRAASVAGVRHRLVGRAPEDAYAWRVVAGAGHETVVLAVADGVGSVDGAAGAAGVAVRAATDAAARYLTASTGPAADGASRPAAADGAPWIDASAAADGAPWIEASAAADGAPWTDVFAAADVAVAAAGGATTLVLAVVGADGRSALARIGDSTALVLDGGRWIEVWPPGRVDDQPVSTATDALPIRDGATPDTASVELGPGAALVLVTDGIAEPLRDGPTTVAPALADGLTAAPSPLGLLLLADFSRQGCFDDRTVVALWRRSASPGPAEGDGPAPDAPEASPA